MSAIQVTIMVVTVVTLVSVIIGFIPLFRDKKMSLVRKMEWAIGMWVLAPVGTILYYVYGRKDEKYFVKKKKEKKLIFEDIGHPPHYPYNMK